LIKINFFHQISIRSLFQNSIPTIEPFAFLRYSMSTSFSNRGFLSHDKFYELYTYNENEKKILIDLVRRSFNIKTDSIRRNMEIFSAETKPVRRIVKR